MISPTQQAAFYSSFFSETQISDWESNSIYKDSYQRLKNYPRLPRHHLPNPTFNYEFSLSDALLQRQSAQQLAPGRFTLSDVSTLLSSVGIREESVLPDDERRMYPSAGARYPGETYLIALNCEAITPGLYHYSPREHGLDELWVTNLREPLMVSTNDQRMLSASAVIIFSLIYGRVAEKYGKRGLRYGLIEIGHMAQNVSLMASLLNKACCEIGGFVDSMVNTWLDVDGDSETATLLMMLGDNYKVSKNSE
jgi:SagB-type dehydrogenase family enzyme